MFHTIHFSPIFDKRFIDFIKKRFTDVQLIEDNEKREMNYIIFTNFNFITILEIRKKFFSEIYYNFNNSLVPLTKNTMNFSDIDDEIKNILNIVYLWTFHYILM